MTALLISCMLVSMAPDLATEAALLARFNAKDHSVELELATVVQPLIREELKQSWKGMRRHHGDLEQATFLRFWELREKGETLEPPLVTLIKRLLDTVGRKLRRERVVAPPREAELRVEATQETSAIARDLVDLAYELPAEPRATLSLHMQHVVAGGPALHVALGIDRASAAKRLVRAQAAMTELLGLREAQHV